MEPLGEERRKRNGSSSPDKTSCRNKATIYGINEISSIEFFETFHGEKLTQVRKLLQNFLSAKQSLLSIANVMSSKKVSRTFISSINERIQSQHCQYGVQQAAAIKYVSG